MTGSLKRLEDTPARFTNANFQEVCAHTLSGKDASEARSSESKGKKSVGHNSGQRGRKPGAGRTPGAVVSTACSFQQGIIQEHYIAFMFAISSCRPNLLTYIYKYSSYFIFEQ